MEIPKSIQQEIIAMQQKLINAIREHQVCMGKLKDDPNNPDIRGQMQEIQLHITSLGRCQKQILQRLRKDVQALKADNTNGSKVSVTSLLGLNNNNHITNNNETKHETTANGFETKPSKEHYEEVITNGDVPSPAQHNDCTKRGPSSVETISGEDDIVEVPMDENSNEKQEKAQKEQKSESEKLEDFLYCLGLITKSKAMELQNKRAERKRRSTANPHFVYSLLEQPIKRQKRYSYLQSGNAPHTRQTTARMNGPSPPPNKAQATKSTSPPVRTVTKSLIPVQKSTTRPNILRNADSKVFVNRNKIEDNTRSSLSSAKSVQSINSKAVHIPGLPSSLTIERIENDSLVCISCRNPGTLTVCENCSSNYHVTCHTRSPASPRICPKCALIMDEGKDVQKNEEAENNERMEGENKRPRPKKSEKLEEKERERYELRERNSELRLQVYELEKRSQLLGQSFQLQQRLRQELLGKQEKTQRSVKRLVDFIKLMQLRKSASSPAPTASVSCLSQPSSSQSPQTIPQTSTNPKTANFPQSIQSSNDMMSYHAIPSFSISTNDQASPTSKQRTRSPISCQAPVSNMKNINHISSSRKSPNQSEGSINLLAVKATTKAARQFSTINCRPRPVATLPSKPVSSSPIPCSSAVTIVRNRPILAQSQDSGVSSARKSFSPSRATISWTERPSTAESPGPSSHAANSVSTSNQSADPPQKSYCHLTVTRAAMSNCKSQGQPSDQQRKQRMSTVVVASTGQQDPVTPSSTHCSQAITGPISSPIVHASSHDASAQTTETVRSCDSNFAVRSTSSWSRANSQTSQQQSSSSGALSRGSSST